MGGAVRPVSGQNPRVERRREPLDCDAWLTQVLSWNGTRHPRRQPRRPREVRVCVEGQVEWQAVWQARPSFLSRFQCPSVRKRVTVSKKIFPDESVTGNPDTERRVTEEPDTREEDKEANTDGPHLCGDGGPLQLRCALCPQSPTYWHRAAGFRGCCQPCPPGPRVMRLADATRC